MENMVKKSSTLMTYPELPVRGNLKKNTLPSSTNIPERKVTALPFNGYHLILIGPVH